MEFSRQHNFILQHLKESSSTVGIDLDASLDGLIEVHNRLAGWEQDIGDAAQIEADRLMKEYGSTDKGLGLLYALGESCMFSVGGTFFSWKWEPDDEWSHSEERSFCDFALSTGVAALRCIEYCSDQVDPPARQWFSVMGAKGATAKNLPMAQLKAWAIRQYENGTWTSANAAGYDLSESVIDHGRTIGAILSKSNAQRTIADWIRAAKKSV